MSFAYNSHPFPKHSSRWQTSSTRSISRIDSGQQRVQESPAVLALPKPHDDPYQRPQLFQYLKGRPPTQLGQDQPPWTYQQATTLRHAMQLAQPDGPRLWQKDFILPVAPQTTHMPATQSKHNTLQLEPSAPMPQQQHPHPQQPQDPHHRSRRKTSSPAIEGWHFRRASSISFFLSLFSICCPKFCLICIEGSQGIVG